MSEKPTYAELEKRILELEKIESECKRTEEALRENVHKYQLLESNVTDVIWILGMDLKFTYISPSVKKLQGYKPEELMQIDLEQAFTPKSYQKVIQTFSEEIGCDGDPGVLPDRSIVLELDTIRKDGSVLPIEVKVSFLRDKAGLPTGVIGITRDVTERKQAEEKIKAYSENLEYMVKDRTKELESKTNKLEEINVALNVLLEKREEDKILLQEQVLSNVKRLALPYVEKLKKGKLTETQIALLDVIESSLHEIVSPFSLQLSSNSFGLTPAEIKVASLIRQGKGTKEIATIRNLSHKTVARHRENIRNKLGIKNTKVNLQSHLTSLA